MAGRVRSSDEALMMLVAAQRRSNDVDSSRSLSALSVARAPVASCAQRISRRCVELRCANAARSPA
jgi:hypothetical protein